MNYPIRILGVFATLDVGGAETMWMNIYRHIDRTLIQFDFVKHKADKCAYEDEILSLGGRIYTAPKLGLSNCISYASWWKKFLRAHPEYHIIHGHYFTISYIYLGIAKKLGRTTIAHSHIAHVPIDGLRSIIKRMLIIGVKSVADFKLACSDDAGRYLYGNSPFTIVRNAIDVEKYKFNSQTRHLSRMEHGYTENDYVIGTVGRLDPQKNPDGVLEIMTELNRINDSFKLLWIGNNEHRDDVVTEIANRGLGPYIKLTGVRNDISNQMQAMDCFILPSIYEGLGIVAIEAQAAGLMCLCSDGVPKEAGITDLCSFMKLGDYSAWAERIAESIQYERRDMTSEITTAGYDVIETANWMQEFYMNCCTK